MRAAWSREDDDALRLHYPLYGPSWDGWEEVLPGRTTSAISSRAKLLGIVTNGRRGRRAQIAAAMPDPNEGYVMRCMEAGMTPTDIDRERKWPPNTTVRILTARWERLGNG